MAQETTETGINIANYIAERNQGTVAITKPVRNSENYVFMRATHSLQIINGQPTAVEGPPELRNINRQSVSDFYEELQKQEDSINAIRSQLSAVVADMDALDLV